MIGEFRRMVHAVLRGSPVIEDFRTRILTEQRSAMAERTHRIAIDAAFAPPPGYSRELSSPEHGEFVYLPGSDPDLDDASQ